MRNSFQLTFFPDDGRSDLRLLPLGGLVVVKVPLHVLGQGALVRMVEMVNMVNDGSPGETSAP